MISGILILLVVLGVLGAGVWWIGQKLLTTSHTDSYTFPEFFGWAVAIVLLGFNIYVYNVNYGVGTALFNLCFLAALYLLFPAAKKTIVVHVMIAMSMLAGFGIAIRANGFVQSVNAVTMIGVAGILVLWYTADQVIWKVAWLLRRLIEFIPASLQRLINIARTAAHPETASKSGFVALLKTAAITFVVLAFFAVLLSNADPVFAELIHTIRDEAIGRALASLVIAVVMAVLLSLHFKSGANEDIKLRWLSFHDLAVPLLGVVILFAIFLMVQAQYLFSTHADLSRFDLTYAQYVRKGFMELLLATFFGSLLVYVAATKLRVLHVASQVTQLQVLTSLMIGELFCVLASALKRDVMYVEVYGLTRVRIIGGVFVFWLGAVLCLLLLFVLFKKIKEEKILVGVLATSFFVVVILNIVNVDKAIVMAPSPQANFKDYFYINNLSEDAVNGWQPSVESARRSFDELKNKSSLTETEKERLANVKLSLLTLREKQANLYKKYGNRDEVESALRQEKTLDPNQEQFEIPEYLDRRRKWQSTIWSELQAYRFVQENKELFGQADVLISEIMQYQETNQIELYDQEFNLLQVYSYPFVNVRLNHYYPQTLEQIKWEKEAEQRAATQSGSLKPNTDGKSRPIRPIPAPEL